MNNRVWATLVLGTFVSATGQPLAFGQEQLRTAPKTSAAPAGAPAPNTPASVPNSAVPATEGVKGVDPNTYRIGPGDVLAVRVWKEDDASIAEAVVRADGKLTVPYVREVDATGLTPTELEQQLTKKLAAYIHNPDVTVIVKSVQSQKVYVTGAVKKEGPITLRAPLTVLEALMEAGGLTEYAKKKKIYVLRTQNAKQIRMPFNYTDVIKGEQQQQNVRLQSGDVIVVPQ